MKSKYILNQEIIRLLLQDHKLVVVDGGARGTIFPPFNRLHPDILKVIRFEPDADATIINNSNDLIFRKALWNSNTSITINITKNGSTSSVYPFNTKLQSYIDPYHNKRKTIKKETVDAIRLDDLLLPEGIDNIDFIKLDIHGAEYEVLQGAKKRLENTLGLLIESWILPIHSNQKLRSDVESLAQASKFHVFEEFHRALWGRSSYKYSKRQLVAIDTLFFKDPLLDDTIDNQLDAIKIIGLADLFHHHAYAEQLLEHFIKKMILDDDIITFLSDHMRKNYSLSYFQRLRDKFHAFYMNKLYPCAFK